MKSIEIVEMLNKLSEMQDQKQVLDLALREKRDEILKPVAEALADLDAEIKPGMDALDEQIAALREEIESAILQRCETVRGDRLQAVYARGRVTWDTRALIGYAATHPEILEFQKLGEPSVVIRGVK